MSEAVLLKLSGYRFRARDEAVLQAGVAAALEAEGIEFVREHRLGPHDRPDFWLPESGTALEVKVAGSLMDVTRQAQRYAEHEEVKDVLIVTTRSVHLGVAVTLAGKPVRVLRIRRGI